VLLPQPCVGIQPIFRLGITPTPAPEKQKRCDSEGAKRQRYTLMAGLIFTRCDVRHHPDVKNAHHVRVMMKNADHDAAKPVIFLLEIFSSWELQLNSMQCAQS
jgi:hypothetical protein